METYEKYKPSGIDWIGEVPEHWDNITLQNSADTFIDGDWIESPDISTEGIRYITTGNIGVLNYKEQGAGYITEETFKKLDCTEVFPGDVLISRLNEPIGRSCIIPELNNRIVTSVDNVIYRPKADIFNKQYVVYQMNCYPYTINANLLARGTTMHRISRSTLGKIKLILPPLAEQEAIAAYLDARCADIDKVVATQQKRIALLQELKQSEITQAVTRGLNPDARMKDSGVEWMGLVPEHWEVKKLKFVVSCNDDVLNDRTKDDQIIRYVEISDVNSIEGITNSTEYEFKEAPSRARRITKKDDVIVSTVRTYLKAIARVKEDGLIVSTGFAVLRAKNINPNFLAYSTLSELFIGTVISESVGVSYPAINSSDIINIKLPVPPSDEQVVIAEHLDRRCGEIDRQIGAVTRQIELLREYKQALITEVVTGKRKV